MKGSRLVFWFPMLAAIGTVCLALVFTALDLYGKSNESLVNKWILYLLTGFVLTLFLDHITLRWERRKSQDEIKGDSSIVTLFKSGIRDVDLGSSRVTKALDQVTVAKRSVLKIGIALSNSFGKEHIDFWAERAAVLRVRVMVIDPVWLEETPEFLAAVAHHLLRDPKILLSQIRETVNNLQSIYALLPEDRSSNLEVRYYRTMPALNLTHTDQETHKAKIFIELLPYGCGFRKRPHLVLEPSDAGWYETFLAVGERMWEDGEKVKFRSKRGQSR